MNHSAAAPDLYQTRLSAEKRFYKDCEAVHNLPEIFHYWSNKYVRPKLEQFGFSSPNAMFENYLTAAHRRQTSGVRHFASLGSGNCDLEVELAFNLKQKGCTDFVIDCLDLNGLMLERGRAAAASRGISDNLNFIEADLNSWNAAAQYDAVIANQSLHHVVSLENLFSAVRSSLKPGGTFIVSDMIGRNGHVRWPEALAMVRAFWRKLPPSYRFNQQLRRYEEQFEDWDASQEGFEGIRSQDILPLLISTFRFHLFVAYGNVIDPFVDRSFGHNFDASEEWDRSFIDRVHQTDEEAIASGRIKPTHMCAILTIDGDVPVQHLGSLTPEFCVRVTGDQGVEELPGEDAHEPYDWQSWPHSTQRELELACQRLKEIEDARAAAGHFAPKANLNLQAELEARTRWALTLQGELDERTAWALNLKTELEEQTALILKLQGELAEQSRSLASLANRRLRSRLSRVLRFRRGS